MQSNQPLSWVLAFAGVHTVGLSSVLLALAAGLLTLTSPVLAQDQERTTQNELFFKIGTGPIGGTYFPVGDVIAAIISHPEGSVRCETVERCGPPGLIAVAMTTQGSVQNVQDVERGLVESALAQANVVEWSYDGTGRFADTPHSNLRVIANLYLESVHLVARADAGISTLSDLRGKRVSIGRRGSGSHTNATQILASFRLNRRNVTIKEISVDQATEEMLEEELDAFFFTGGAPVPVVQELAEAGKITLIPIEGPPIERLQRRAKFFVETTIPEGVYPNIGTVRTLGVGALWIAHDTMDEDLIYRLTRALWHPDNAQLLVEGHPQGGQMSPQNAVNGVPIPFHTGAEKFYREMKLLPEPEPEPTPIIKPKKAAQLESP